MKTLFIPTYSNSKANKDKILEISKELPSKLAIYYSIQYQSIANEIKFLFENTKKHKILGFSQILGCSKPILKEKPQAILLIGSGRFHASSLSLETNIPIYILDNNNFQKISEKEIQSFKIKRKAAYLHFLNSDKAGIIISNKPGQQNLERALKLKNNIKDKSSYLFVSNEINPQEFENFPQIQSWINTACPRLDMASKVINIGDLNLSD